MDCIYRSNAEDTECIHAVVLSDDVSDDNSIDDGRNLMEMMWTREMTRRVQEMLHWMMIAEMK